MDPIREREVFWRGYLSVQASSGHYCSPRKDGLPFEDYTAYEVGLYRPSGGLTRPSSTLGWLYKLLPFLPRAREARSLDALFEDGSSPVAGWVSAENVNRLRDFMGRIGT